jgi:hypothetical protein
MFCPQCGCEYRVGFSTCPDCDLELVEELPAVDIRTTECPDCDLELVEESTAADIDIAEWKEMVTIATISDAAFLLVAKSILQDAGIPYLAKNEGVQDLFGVGRLGTGFTIFAQPVELQVPREFVDDATRLLDEIERPEEP